MAQAASTPLPDTDSSDDQAAQMPQTQYDTNLLNKIGINDMPMSGGFRSVGREERALFGGLTGGLTSMFGGSSPTMAQAASTPLPDTDSSDDSAAQMPQTQYDTNLLNKIGIND